jgi:hypothetical protein
MNANNLYPRKYATGEDLAGKTLTLTVEAVSIDKMRPHSGAPETEKPVLWFAGAKKGIIASRTLITEIVRVLGEEMDDWQGKQVTLYTKPIKVAGVDRVQIHAKAPQEAATAA